MKRVFANGSAHSQTKRMVSRIPQDLASRANHRTCSTRVYVGLRNVTTMENHMEKNLWDATGGQPRFLHLAGTSSLTTASGAWIKSSVGFMLEGSFSS